MEQHPNPPEEGAEPTPMAGPPPPPMPPPPPSGVYPPGSTMAGLEAPPGGYPTTATGPKNPVIALLVSLVLPGLGQLIINEEKGKGIALLVAYVVCLALFFLIITLLVAFGIWVFAMWDAYQGAKKWNVAHGFPAG